MPTPSLSTLPDALGGLILQADLLSTAHKARAERLQGSYAEAQTAVAQSGQRAWQGVARCAPSDVMTHWAAYWTDALQRGLLTADVLRQNAQALEAHEAAGAPPVLVYDYEVILEGRDLKRPSNYRLLQIIAPEGVETFDWKRPYVIIDPRAGHGPGIGGFKPDSQVGVALRDGHPVYFVAFHQQPEPDQRIADVTHSEAAFLRTIHDRHPQSPKPVVVGNCQGGWATAILAATHPDLPGPIVLNGAPMSYWGGKLGQDPMRYGGGLAGGVTPALMASDLGGGVFDGAALVQNFESLNPGRTWFRKYYDLYCDPDARAARFLEFEKWWGSFYLMTDHEIRWIVENLFVGNKLSKNEAQLEPGRPIDLRHIRSPIIVFASHGDNITPPAQALNWIVDSYADETEIEICGQRILYMIHEEVGHLGIFVSSSVARREHAQMASTLKTIEALPPGLYEMQIEDHAGEGDAKSFTVSFAQRRMEDIIAATGRRRDEAAFAGVARGSAALAEVYDTTLGPVLRHVPPQVGAMLREAHPMRSGRRVLGQGALAETIASAAAQTRENRAEPEPDNPFLAFETWWAEASEQGWNMLRDLREAAMETGFLSLWATPWAMWYGTPYAHHRARRAPEDLRNLPVVQAALRHIHSGGLAEATVRMLVLLANSRAEVRKDQLERSSEVLSTRAPFAEMTHEQRASLIQDQGLIVHFEPEAAIDALPTMLRRSEDAAQAIATARYILGDESDMTEDTKALWTRLQTLLHSDAPTSKEEPR